MVCASSLAYAMPAASQMPWVHSARSADWSAKDHFAGDGVEILPPTPAATGMAVGCEADGVPLQMAPVQICQMQVVVCDANGVPQQPAFAWPVYPAAAQGAAFALGGPQASQQPPVCHAPAEQQQAAPALSTSAKRRLRRQRAAAQRPADAPELPEDAPPRGGASPHGASRLDCGALAEALEAGGEARAAALAELRGSVAQLTLEREGCRLVQAAIQLADRAAAAELLAELHGRVLEASASQHGNYVIQTVVAALPTAMSGFVVRELLGSGAEVARHRFGCRILCRLVEHSGGGEDLAALLEELLAEAEDLCRHPFAHYVVETMLEHLPEARGRVAAALGADLWGSACHRCASHVVEAALAHCGEAERQGFALRLLGGGRDSVLSLAQNQFGSFVLKALLQVPGRLSEEALGHISQAVTLLEGAKYGQRLLQDLGLSAGAAA
mmetsp:Transcript_16057/g.32631  ORF Transcript_16057/g.32631 Transcript_16057/m.32631 type:complete len:442 (-) Transcript_16057:333-1658(-)